MRTAIDPNTEQGRAAARELVARFMERRPDMIRLREPDEAGRVDAGLSDKVIAYRLKHGIPLDAPKSKGGARMKYPQITVSHQVDPAAYQRQRRRAMRGLPLTTEFTRGGYRARRFA